MKIVTWCGLVFLWQKMKFPKNKANLYMVERYNRKDNSSVVVGGFSDQEEADNYRDACEQEWKDKTNNDVSVSFGVTLTTFYG